MNTFSKNFKNRMIEYVESIDFTKLDKIVSDLVLLRERKGRLFILGVGGSAANCSHAVNDFRKLAGIDAMTPTDNVSELTARTNDEGWDSVFSETLKVSNFSGNDSLLILSVGGGSIERNLSVNLINACRLADELGAAIYSFTGKPDGAVAQASKINIHAPELDELLTPLSEAFQAVLWHYLVSHPILKERGCMW